MIVVEGRYRAVAEAVHGGGTARGAGGEPMLEHVQPSLVDDSLLRRYQLRERAAVLYLAAYG